MKIVTKFIKLTMSAIRIECRCGQVLMSSMVKISRHVQNDACNEYELPTQIITARAVTFNYHDSVGDCTYTTCWRYDT